jgi:hypothetical protein
MMASLGPAQKVAAAVILPDVPVAGLAAINKSLTE